jgi:LacI family transcriptional regulator
MAEAGLPVPERPLGHGEFNESSGREAIQGLLRSGRVPRAIVVGNDQMAVGVMSALTAAGVAVPGQVAVTGFDDIQLARHVTPALTTVHQPMRELGSHSVRLLLDQLEGRPGSREVILPTALVIRESCGCPPACPEPH